MKHLTASDREALIRLASQMAPGSPERKAILAGLHSISAMKDKGGQGVLKLSPVKNASRGAPERRLASGEGKKASRLNLGLARRMDPEDAMYAVDSLSERTARKIRLALDTAQEEILVARETIRDLERAWSKWDWVALEKMGIVTKGEADFALEVLASYTW